MKLSRYGNTIRIARPPATLGEKRARAAGTVLMFAGMAYVFWARATDSGLVGWLDALQARGSGRYNETLSFFLAMVAIFVAAFLIALPLARLGHGAREPVQARPATVSDMLTSQSRLVWIIGCGIIVAIWAGGLGAYEYYTHRNRAEMRATYEPVDVAVPTGTSSGREFVALSGKVPAAGYLKRTDTKGQDGTFFIPIVARTTRDPHVPVHWVIRADGSSPPYFPAVIFGHATGETLPQTVRDAFERDGTTIAADAMLVSYVATDNTGTVLDVTENYLPLFLGVCGAVSLVTLMMIGAYRLKLRILQRRLTRVS